MVLLAHLAAGALASVLFLSPLILHPLPAAVDTRVAVAAEPTWPTPGPISAATAIIAAAAVFSAVFSFTRSHSLYVPCVYVCT